MKKFIRELGVPFAALIIFFIFQSKGSMSEFVLTAFIVAISILTAFLKLHKRETLLFFLGVAFGSFIEIGLRYFGYQQVWTDASLYGVPYWLPLVWGFGFVVITRLGMVVRHNTY